MIIFGIDPGFTGALAKIDTASDITRHDITLYPMPTMKIGKGSKKQKTFLDLQKIREILTPIPNHVFIEKAQVMPDQGVVSSGNYLREYGKILGLLVGMNIRHTEIHPRSWKCKLMKDMPKEKGASVVRVKQMFPDLPVEPGEHGKADALLIALYGMIEV